MSFAEAVATLPLEATPAIELSWIRSHPAMARQERNPNRGEPILLTADDILSPANGKAPSRSAAHELQHWVNSPEEFWKKGYDERRKKQGTPHAGNKVEMLEDADEIRRMLAQIEDGLPRNRICPVCAANRRASKSRMEGAESEKPAKPSLPADLIPPVFVPESNPNPTMISGLAPPTAFRK